MKARAAEVKHKILLRVFQCHSSGIVLEAMQPGLPLHGAVIIESSTNQMGLRSSIDCPTSSKQCYPSTQSIFVAQSKGMHQVTNILLHFNQQSTSNVMHAFLVLKEMGLRSSINCSTSSIQCYPSTQPIFVAQSKGVQTNILLDFSTYK
ncbi:hypothetical protein C4D60_Mb08t31370 [Musa balbisiana]|uniref:Uncharacterized protein n=1 Tax=Musa balbisiana TaxID=52838 RepID=A0A4S8K7W7_MUSBA|nr:hypothetical protein C4D60_Mb08t31370 [Musa balbisiana]